MAARFLELAASPDRDGVEAVPFASRVALGLGNQHLVDRSAEDLAELAGWTLDVDAFGREGPLSVLEPVAAPSIATVTLVGDHPHCASPPLPPAAEFADLRRVAIQPDPGTITSCIDWWSIDLYVTGTGEVAAVTLELWEP